MILPSWLTAKVALVAGGVGLAALLAAGAWGTTMLIQRNLARAEIISVNGKLEEETQRASRWQGQFEKLSALSQEQNTAIEKLKAAQDKAQRDHEAELKKAQAKAQPGYERGRVVMTFRPPPGKDPIEETRAMIDELLRKEREGVVP